MKKPINLSNDSNEIKQVANGRLCCAIRCPRYTVSNGGPPCADFAPLFPNLVIFIGVMDMLENTDDAGGKTDRIVEV